MKVTIKEGLIGISEAGPWSGVNLQCWLERMSSCQKQTTWDSTLNRIKICLYFSHVRQAGSGAQVEGYEGSSRVKKESFVFLPSHLQNLPHGHKLTTAVTALMSTCWKSGQREKQSYTSSPSIFTFKGLFQKFHDFCLQFIEVFVQGKLKMQSFHKYVSVCCLGREGDGGAVSTSCLTL